MEKVIRKYIIKDLTGLIIQFYGKYYTGDYIFTKQKTSVSVNLLHIRDVKLDVISVERKRYTKEEVQDKNGCSVLWMIRHMLGTNTLEWLKTYNDPFCLENLIVHSEKKSLIDLIPFSDVQWNTNEPCPFPYLPLCTPCTSLILYFGQNVKIKDLRFSFRVRLVPVPYRNVAQDTIAFFDGISEENYIHVHEGCCWLAEKSDDSISKRASFHHKIQFDWEKRGDLINLYLSAEESKLKEVYENIPKKYIDWIYYNQWYRPSRTTMNVYPKYLKECLRYLKKQGVKIENLPATKKQIAQAQEKLQYNLRIYEGLQNDQKEYWKSKSKRLMNSF